MNADSTALCVPYLGMLRLDVGLVAAMLITSMYMCHGFPGKEPENKASTWDMVTFNLPQKNFFSSLLIS